jgi:capsular exopolysaccharide synthesis family protein
MAKVYEALQRAEEERKRKYGGDAGPEPSSVAVEWDPTPQSAPRRRIGLLRRMLSMRAAAEDVPNSAGEINKRRIAILQPESYVAEQFRTLRGRIDSLSTQRPIKTVAITSCNQDEGKSTAAVNLAAVTSMSVGRNVLLMDCDLRRPKIHRSLGLEPRTGIAEVLLGQATFDEAVMKVEGLSLDVLAVRNPPLNPSELLASPGMQKLVEHVKGRYDQVILDTPACLGLPDSKTVSELCDGIVFVVRAGVTPSEDVQLALEILDRRLMLGFLLNGVEASRRQYGYY